MIFNVFRFRSETFPTFWNALRKFSNAIVDVSKDALKMTRMHWVDSLTTSHPEKFAPKWRHLIRFLARETSRTLARSRSALARSSSDDRASRSLSSTCKQVYAQSFDFRYFTNSCENPVRTRFPWSNLYVFTGLFSSFIFFWKSPNNAPLWFGTSSQAFVKSW